MNRIIKAGVALLILCSALQPARAADVAIGGPEYKAAPPATPFVADPWSWAGFNVGLNGGYSIAQSNSSVSFANSVTGPFAAPANSVTAANFNVHGYIFGGQLGYNWAFATYVVGLEADFQWTSQQGSFDFLCAANAGGGAFGPCSPSLAVTPAGATGATLSLEQKLSWFGTVRARIGAEFTPRIIGYLTGGLAYGQITTDGTFSGFTAAGTPVTTAFNSSTTKGGWTAGVGFEGRLLGHWSAKLEYLYIDLGTVQGAAVNAPGQITATYSSHPRDNIFRVGLNYRFYSPLIEDFY
jgi:outer membrane immunogenic protein